MFEFHITKFIHLLCGLSFFGITLVNYAVVTRTLKHRDAARLAIVLRSSLAIDFLVPIVIFIVFSSGALLAIISPYHFYTPWVQAAFGLLTVSSFLWLGSVWIKRRNFHALIQHNNVHFRYLKIYHILNLTIFLCLLIIIHDAVMRHTI